MMLRPHASTSVLVVAMMLLTAVVSPAVEMTYDYNIDIDGLIGTVNRTVSTLQGEFTVTQVGHADANDTVSVSVDAPDDSGYTIMILDSEQRSRRTADAAGDASHEFGTGGLRPGAYAVVAGNQSTKEVYTGEPLVIRACAVSTQAAESVKLSNGLDVTAELDKVESGRPIEAVEVVLANDSENLRVGASAVNDTHCSTSVSTDNVGTGDYSLYVVVRNDDQALGENELIGASDVSTVEVVERSNMSTPGEGSGDASGDGGDGGGTTDDATETTIAESDSTSTSTIDTVTTADDDELSTTELTETTGATKPTATTATDNVVAPNELTTTVQTTTSSEVSNTALRVLFDALIIFAVSRRLIG